MSYLFILIKHKILSILLCLALLTSFSSIFATGVAANNTNGTPATSLAVYVQQGNSGTPLLLKTYTQADMQTLTQTTQYYTGIDSMPSVVQGKAIGVLLSTLINDLQQHDPNISFGSGDSINLSCTDGYNSSFTYDYLLGATRYYYPNLYTSSEDDSILGSTTGTVPAEPMFAMTSYESRSFDNDLITQQVLDNAILDSTKSFRFCFGLLPSDISSETDSVSKFDKWVNQMVIVMPTLPTTTSTTTTNTTSDVVTFVSDGTIYTTVNATDGLTITAPTAPTKTGCTFAGWYSDQAFANAVTFPYTVTGNTTFYAKWVANTVSTITLFSPNSGGMATSVVIIGTNLTAATAVSFGGTAAHSFTINSATQITAIVASGASGVISIMTPNGTVTSTSNFTFTSTPAYTSTTVYMPTVTSFWPVSGGSGTSVVITGNNFTGTTSVSFGGTAASNFAVNSSTQIIAIVGSGASGVISVITPNGTAVSTSNFTFTSTPAYTSTTASTSVPTPISTLASTPTLIPTALSTSVPTPILPLTSTPTPTSMSMITPSAIDSNNEAAALTFDLAGLTDNGGSFIKDYSDQEAAGGNVTFIARLDIKAGTVALTPDNQQINSVTITTQDLSQIPKTNRKVIVAFECSPGGSVFSSPIELTIRYDPSLIPLGVSEKNLVLAYYDTHKDAWVDINSQIDPSTHVITGQVRHLTLFSILPKETPLASWEILLAVVGIEVVLICIVALYVIQMKNSRGKVTVLNASASGLKDNSEVIHNTQVVDTATSPHDFSQSEIPKVNNQAVPIISEEVLQSIEIDKGNTNINSVDIFLEDGGSSNALNSPIKITTRHETRLDSKNTIKIRISKLPKINKT